MNRKSSLLVVLILLAALFVCTRPVFATPEPGRYVGSLRITKTLPPYYTNALSTSVTMRIVAQVAQSGSGRILTILAAAVEPPMDAFDAGKSAILGNFRADGSCVIHGPPFGGAPNGSSDYLGIVTEFPAGFSMRHDNLPLGVQFLVDPHLTQAITDFEYRLERVR